MYALEGRSFCISGFRVHLRVSDGHNTAIRHLSSGGVYGCLPAFLFWRVLIMVVNMEMIVPSTDVSRLSVEIRMWFSSSWLCYAFRSRTEEQARRWRTMGEGRPGSPD